MLVQDPVFKRKLQAAMSGVVETKGDDPT
jgi:hypothetical protein